MNGEINWNNNLDEAEITNEERLLFQRIYQETCISRDASRPYTIAIDGTPTSGKSFFCSKFRRVLEERGENIVEIHADDFHHDSKVRNSCDAQAEGFYRYNIDYQRMVDSVLIPLLRSGEKSIYLEGMYNYSSDRCDLDRSYDLKSATMIIVEGILLFRKHLLDYFNYRIFLVIDDDEALSRQLKRWEGKRPTEVIKHRHTERYQKGYELYEAKHEPRKSAHLVIDNTTLGKPRPID